MPSPWHSNNYTPGSVPAPWAQPRECAFDAFVRTHNIAESEWERSPELRAWVKRKANHHYVPESLLTKFGMKIYGSVDWREIAGGRSPRAEGERV